MKITVEVPDPPRDAELRAAAEALVLSGSDSIGDLFTRNLVAVGAPAYRRLAAACAIDLPLVQS